MIHFEIEHCSNRKAILMTYEVAIQYPPPYKKVNLCFFYDNIQLLPSYEVNIESCQPEGDYFPQEL